MITKREIDTNSYYFPLLITDLIVKLDAKRSDKLYSTHHDLHSQFSKAAKALTLPRAPTLTPLASGSNSSKLLPSNHRRDAGASKAPVTYCLQQR